ncbi:MULTISPECIES: ABATE domain-containing protein [unclassified Streptomyces]|uniref:CGNR zinc finger domain-containing protein n=1 Tax=unclassified Streptomyces TaxID=2593676 RepID=UPI002DDB7A59|nr:MULTISPECIES: ABATE domain-containing protein [unclassified Streptomyces]WSA91863.1 ABATE domain-containing protein [Streptomyces sp. NBC_01795]WSB76232.1 ABATE domain-containing protein [Streptomyces sp. NBC_01775]WSS15493.1 ABATE domain-containing protein [Streptomyces sp. NBC_01186]WSS44336.1 ABATE domain-containing protein [Streptomyces sp. NBC_01187]
MTGSSAEGFRLGNEILAFRFVATLGERRADPVERIATPEQLRAWLTVNGLGGADMPVSETHLRDARTLREAIHRAGTALASGGVPEAADEEVLNRWAARHRARLVLSGGQARWHLPDGDPARAALAVVAVDAVATLGGPGEGVIKSCEQHTCGGLFVDTSRGGRRRWCSMATCGNKVKKANLKAARGGAGQSATAG